MFFYVPKVLMNQGITRRAKLIYLFVVLIEINVDRIVCLMVIWNNGFKSKNIKLLVYNIHN